MALTEVVLVPGDAIVPVPLTNDQLPVAGAFAVFAVNVAFGAVLQACWSAPAFAAPCPLLFTMIATSSVLIGFAHAPLLIVQRKMFVPIPSPVTPLVGDPGVLIVPLPLTRLQMPVLGGVGLFPASEVMVVGVHNCWSGPAFAVAAFALYTVMVTLSVVGGPQGPLLIVHCNVTVPMPRPVTVVVGEDGMVMVAVPLSTAHVPVLGVVGTLPASVAVGELLHTLWSGPALATGAAGSKRVIVTWSWVMPFAHGPLLRVHWNTLAPTPRPLTPDEGDVGEAMVPEPLTSVHCPVAGAMGALPPSVAVVVQTCWSAPALAFGEAALNTVIVT